MAPVVAASSSPPEYRDLALEEFQYKQLCRISIGQPLKNQHFCQLVATNDRYGIVAAGHATGIKLFYVADILENDVPLTDKVNTIVEDLNILGSVTLSAEPVHIGFSIDGLTMSVACHASAIGNSAVHESLVSFYDVRSFLRTKTPEPFLKSSLCAGRDCSVHDLRWNPEECEVFAACLSNGSLIMGKLTTPGQIELKELAPQSASNTSSFSGDDWVTCISWSPKGKQLVAGRVDGSLLQFSKALEVKASVPPLPDMGSVAVLSVLWQSTYVFFASYVDRSQIGDVSGDNEAQPVVAAVHVAKDTQKVEYVNYGDLCYGGPSERQCGYYLLLVPSWDVVVTLSATAVNTCTLGKVSTNQPWPWQQWSLGEPGEIAMPVQQAEDADSFPCGVALSLTAQKDIPGQGPDLSYRPSPVVFVLSTEGLLMPYHVISRLPGAVSITKPPAQLSAAGKEVTAPLPTGKQTSGQPQALQPVATAASFANKQPGHPSAFGSGTLQNLVPASLNAEVNAVMKVQAPVISPGQKSFGPPITSAASVQPQKTVAIKADVAPLLAFNKTSAGASEFAKPPTAIDGSLPKQQALREQNVAIVQSAPTSAVSAVERGRSAPSIDDLFAMAISEEVADFGREVAALRSSHQKPVTLGDIGSKDELVALKNELNRLMDIGKSIKGTVEECGTDVHGLKLKVLETFALLEQCRSLQRCYDHPEYRELLKSRPLDPLLKVKVQEIDQLYHSVKQGLVDLSERVEDDWAAFVRKDKASSGAKAVQNHSASPGQMRMRLADAGRQALDCNDKIYSATKAAELILHSQELLADELSKRLKALQLGDMRSNDAAVAYSSAQHGPLLRDRSANHAFFNASNISNSKHEMLTSGRLRRLTPEGNAALRRYLGTRRVTTSSAAMPANLSLSKVVAAEKLRKQLGLMQQSSAIRDEDHGDSAARRHQADVNNRQQGTGPVTVVDIPKPVAAIDRHAAAQGAMQQKPSEVPFKTALALSVLADVAQDQKQGVASSLPVQGAALTPGDGAVTSQAGKGTPSVFASVVQRQPAIGGMDKHATAAAESMRSTPTLSSASQPHGSGVMTFKPMAPAAGQLPLGSTGSGGTSSAFSLFGSSSRKPSTGKVPPGMTTPAGEAMAGTLPAAALLSGKLDAAAKSAGDTAKASGSAVPLPNAQGQSVVSSKLPGDTGNQLPQAVAGSVFKNVGFSSPANGDVVVPAVSTGDAAANGKQPSSGTQPSSTRVTAVASSEGSGALSAVSQLGPTRGLGEAPPAAAFSVLKLPSDVFSSPLSSQLGTTNAAVTNSTTPVLISSVPSELKLGTKPAFGMPTFPATPLFGSSTSAATAGGSVQLPAKPAAGTLFGSAITSAAPSIFGSMALSGAVQSNTSSTACSPSPTVAVATTNAVSVPVTSAGAAVLTDVPTTAASSGLSGTSSDTSEPQGATLLASSKSKAAESVGQQPDMVSWPASALPALSGLLGPHTAAAQPAIGAPSLTASVASAVPPMLPPPVTVSAASQHPTEPSLDVPPMVPAPSSLPSSTVLAATTTAVVSSALPAVANPIVAAIQLTGTVVTAAVSSAATVTSAPAPASGWTDSSNKGASILGTTAAQPFAGMSAFGGTGTSGGLFGKPPPFAASSGNAATTGRGSSTPVNALGDTEMSTEQEEGGSGGFFGGDSTSGLLGIGGKADPEKAKLNPFGMISAGSTSGSSEAAKLFGSPARTSAFGAPVFGSAAVTLAANSPPAVFGVSPAQGPSGSGLAQSPFASAAAGTPSVFGGGAFGSAPAHGQFGGPPAFGAGSAFGAAGSAFGGASVFGGSPSVFGGAPVFGASAHPRAFGGSTPASSVFGGQAQIGASQDSAAATFGSFAAAANASSQPTFGMLAQQQSPAPQPTFGMLAHQQAPAAQAASPFGSGGAFGSGSPVAPAQIQSKPSFMSYRK